MRAKTSLIALFAVLLGGCLPTVSVYPLHDKGTVVFDPNLVGTWVEDSNDPNEADNWQFKAHKDDKGLKAYELRVADEDGKGLFFAYLVRLEGKLFLDLVAAKLPWEDDLEKADWPYNVFLLLPANLFLRVESIEPVLKMRAMDDDKFKKLLEADPKVLRHTVSDERLVLTADTKELQAFMLKHADDKNVWGDPVILKKQPE